jgi:hypothetical protein
MKKGTLILLLVVLILGISAFLLMRKPWSNSQHDATAFAIKDTAKVTRIFLADKAGKTVMLQRKANNTWTANNNVLVDHTKINLILTTLHDLQVKMPVSPSMHNTAMGILGSKGIKCEVYEGEHLLKVIYIGTETPDKEGTFMILEGEDQPYIIQQPGFIGFLTPRFSTEEIKWRSKLIFNAAKKDIEEITIRYPSQESESFVLNAITAQKQGFIKDIKGGLVQTDTLKTNLLLNAFEQLYAEGFYDETVFTKAERDSVFGLKAFVIIQLKLNNGDIQHLSLFEKLVGDKTKDRFDDNQRERSIDPEKFFAKVGSQNLAASVQEYAFRRVLIKKSDLQMR